MITYRYVKIVSFILVIGLLCGPVYASDSVEALLLPRPAESSVVTEPTRVEDLSVRENTRETQEYHTEVQGSLTLKDSGMPDGLKIDAHQPQSGFTFTIPNDRVVVNAQLLLKINASPALVDGQHYLNVMLNGQPLAQLPINQADEPDSTFSMDIPAPMLVAINNLSVVLENSKTLQCEIDSENRYRLTILPESSLHYQGVRLDTIPELSRFPWPFVDPLEMGRQQVAMVFPRAPSADLIKSASVVSSFLGLQADYKGIDLPVSLGELPQSNAIVFAHPGVSIGELDIPAASGASLQIINNPRNPIYKLLIVSGKNEDELNRAAFALTHNRLPAAPQTTGLPTQRIPVRHPYDADRWVSTERPLQFSQLISDNTRLSVTGLSHETIRLGFRTAPDLYMWDGETLPMKVRYHFPGNQWIDEDASALGVSLNGRFLQNLSVNRTGGLEKLWHMLGGDTRLDKKTLNIQPWQIYGDNQFAFYFSVKAKKNAPCLVYSDSSIKSAIDPTSTLDLSHSWHFSELPNLSYFISADFPFSRHADLSQTLVLMAAQPDSTEIGTLLTFMARHGNATGVTSHGAEIVLGEGLAPHLTNYLQRDDVLVVSNFKHNSLLQAVLAQSPFEYANQQITLRPMTLFQQVKSFIYGDWEQQNNEAMRYLASASDWRGFISFKSPWARNRSVVLVTATQIQQMAKLPNDLQNPKTNADIKGDLAVIADTDGVHSWHIGSHYVSGQMPWYLRVFWFTSQHFLALGLLCGILALLLGLTLYFYLQNQSQRRLKNYSGLKQKKDIQ